MQRCWLMWIALAAIMLLAAPVAAAGPIAWMIPSWERVRPDAPAGSATDLTVCAARGEVESFQIVVAGPASGVRVIPPSSSLGLRLYREQFVLVAKGTTSYGTQVNKPEPPGYFPDGLIPFDAPGAGIARAIPCDIEAGKVQPFWVDVVVPRGAAPSDYLLPFVVSGAAGETTLFARVKVWAFSLPQAPTLRSAMLYSSALRRSSQATRLLLEHRLEPYGAAASLEADLYALGMRQASLGFWGSADKAAGTMAAPPAQETLAAAVGSHLAGLRLYNYTADEISGYPALFDDVQAWARVLHPAGVDQLITMPPNPALFDDGAGGGRSAVDVWVELPKQYDPDLVAQALARGDKVWSYNCLNQDGYSPKWVLDYGQPNFRLQAGMLNWQLGMTGILYWRLDYWGSAPWTSGENYSLSGFPGEGMWVYPGADIGLPVEAVAPSIRLKWVRDGVDDYDYLRLLDAAGLTTWAGSVIAPVATDWRNWSRDPAAIEAVRRQLGDKLHSLAAAASATATATITVATEPHELRLSVSAMPARVASRGAVTLTAAATDSWGHPIASWSWSDGGAGGSFSPSALAQSPTYTAPQNRTGRDVAVTLALTATCSGQVAARGQATIMVARKAK